MKLNDKTLTGITAVLLATGVGAAGMFLRSDGSDPVPQQTEITALMDVSPLQQAVAEPFEQVVPVQVPAETEAPRIQEPDGLSQLQPADKVADLSDLTEIQVLPIGDVTAEIVTPSLDIPKVAAPTVPVFASVEPATRTRVSPIDNSLHPGVLMEVAPELAALAAPPVSEPSSVYIVVLESITTASLPKKMSDQQRSDAAPSGYTRIPADFCNVEVRATPKSSARVQLRLHAKCHPNSVVTISHAGLQFQEKLGEFGQLALTIPAFSEFSVFGIELADGIKASAGAFVSGLSRIERVGISWSGTETTFLMHMNQ